MELLQAEILEKNKIGKTTETVIKLIRKDKTNMSMELVKEAIEGLEKRTKSKKGKISVAGLNCGSWTTIKAFNKDFDEDEIDDYYQNRIKPEDRDKFKEFIQIHITIIMQQ